MHSQKNNMDNLSFNVNVKLEDNTFQAIHIEQAQIEQVVSLINRSFIRFDPVYKKYLTNIQQIYEETKYYVQAAIIQKLAFGLKLKERNRIIGVTMLLDAFNIKEIIEVEPKNKDQKMIKFQKAREKQQQLGNIILNMKVSKKGEFAFGCYLSIDPQFVNYQLGPLCQAFGFTILFNMGYKKFYGIIYNPVSLKIFTDFGGKIVTKLKDQEQKLEFCFIQLQCTQANKLKEYIEINKQKTLKQMIKKPLTQTPKSKL